MKQLSFLLLCTVMSAAAMENTNSAQPLADGAENTPTTPSTASPIIDDKAQNEENRATQQKDKLLSIPLISQAFDFVNKHADILPYTSIQEITFLCDIISKAARENKLIYITRRNIKDKAIKFICLDNLLRKKKNTEHFRITKPYWNKDEENVLFYVITMDDLARDKEHGPFHIIRKIYLDKGNVLFPDDESDAYSNNGEENVLFSEDESDAYSNNGEENVLFPDDESDAYSKKRKHQNLNNVSNDSETPSKKRKRLDTNINASQFPPRSQGNGELYRLLYLSKDQLCDEVPKLYYTETDEINVIDILNHLCITNIKCHEARIKLSQEMSTTKLKEIYDIIKLPDTKTDGIQKMKMDDIKLWNFKAFNKVQNNEIIKLHNTKTDGIQKMKMDSIKFRDLGKFFNTLQEKIKGKECEIGKENGFQIFKFIYNLIINFKKSNVREIEDTIESNNITKPAV